VPLKSID